MKANRILADSIPYITTSQSVGYFGLTGMDESTVALDDLKNQSQALVFIFARPCTPCNQNIPFWNKIAQILGDKIKIYGIVLDDLSSAYNFHQKAKLKFKVFVPNDLELFINSWKIRYKNPQTILMRSNRPVFLVQGNLEAEDISEFIKKILDQGKY